MSSSNPNHCYTLIPSLTSTANPNTATFHDLGQRQPPPPTALWDYWDHTNNNNNSNAISASAHQYPILGVNAPFVDYQPQQQQQQQAAAPPLLPPVGNFPFYVDQSGSTQAIKAEDHAVGSGGRIGLNLGYRTYFSSGDAAAIDRLFRRSRGLFPSSQPVPRCQAEGCKADLSGAKHYHRRHKVCEFHSKATVVVAAGLQQRFCQQCSRFHVLSEFDEAKRSCRKRLADHNRRRRKPQQTCTQNADNNEESNASGEMDSKGTANSCSGSNAAANTSGGATGICGGTNATVVADIGGGASRSSSSSRKVVTMTQLRESPALSLGGSVDDHHYSHGGGVRPTFVVNSSQVGDQECSNHHHHRHHHWSSPSSSSFFPQRQGGGGPSSFNEGASQLGQGLFELDFM